MGTYLKSLVTEQLLTVGQEEKQLVIPNKSFDKEFPVTTVVVDDDQVLN